MSQRIISYHRILVVKLRYHGDMLLTTPLISTLKANYPVSYTHLTLPTSDLV